jgi:hypothetical protein
MSSTSVYLHATIACRRFLGRYSRASLTLFSCCGVHAVFHCAYFTLVGRVSLVFYETTRRHIPEGSFLQVRRRKYSVKNLPFFLPSLNYCNRSLLDFLLTLEDSYKEFITEGINLQEWELGLEIAV